MARWKIRVVEAESREGQTWGQRKVIGVHKRKSGKRTYISPRIVLSSKFNDLIGKGYETMRVKVKRVPEWEYDSALDKADVEEALILFLGKRQTSIPRRTV